MAYIEDMREPLHTVVETSEYLQAAKRAKLTDRERTEIINHFAQKPDDGTPLGGGLYKTRIARSGSGKSGGYRTVHFYRSETLPVFLLTVFAKNTKDNMSKAEQNAVTDEASRIGKTYGGSYE